MAKSNRLARRAGILASLAVVAIAATAVPLQTAAADNWHYNNGHGNGGYGHDWHGGGYDHNWHGGGYNGGYRGGYYPQSGVSFFFGAPPAYYYPPAPVYYAPPPVYYPPAPVYGPPGISLDFVIPLRFH